MCDCKTKRSKTLAILFFVLIVIFAIFCSFFNNHGLTSAVIIELIFWMICIAIIIFIAVWLSYYFLQFVMKHLKQLAREDADTRAKEIEKKLHAMNDSCCSVEKVKKEMLENRLREAIKDRDIAEEPSNYENEMVKWVGMLERTIYIGACLLGHPEFIGVWIVFKAIGNWGDRRGGRIDRFVIGTGLNIIIAVVAVFIIKLIC